MKDQQAEQAGDDTGQEGTQAGGRQIIGCGTRQSGKQVLKPGLCKLQTGRLIRESGLAEQASGKKRELVD